MRGVRVVGTAGDRPLGPGAGDPARDPGLDPPSSFFHARGVAGNPAPREVDMALAGTADMGRKPDIDGRRDI